MFFFKVKTRTILSPNLHEKKRRNLHLKCTQCECVKSDIIKSSLQTKTANSLFKVKRDIKRNIQTVIQMPFIIVNLLSTGQKVGRVRLE